MSGRAWSPHGYDVGPSLPLAAVLERFLRAFGVPGPTIPSGSEERAELYRSLPTGEQALVLDNAASRGPSRLLFRG
ncbi:hypothetical protein [Streptomyces sp. PRh5]|uniref:hypothetical protein n=1 Tax=Streptomyces sp. PRh5 TaxID=1158056 RepID=UPI0004BA4F54